MPHFTKSVLSQYLRTRCEKQLFLSLFTADEILLWGFPPPLKLRPQIQMVTAAGRDWEAEKYVELNRFFPGRVRGLNADGTKRNVNLDVELDPGSGANSFVVEGTLRHQDLQSHVGRTLRMSDGDLARLPAFGDFRPDVVWARERLPNQFAISAQGLVIPIPESDNRTPLTVIDIKHAASGNPSYNSEVTLYALILANWLELTGRAQQFYVSDQVGLWTKPHGQSSLPNVGAHAPLMERAQALLADIEWVPSLQFLPTVRDFISTTLPTVLGKRFEQLEWHVDGRCSACDWLAQPEWLTRPDNIAAVEASGQYCHDRAFRTRHLSRVATLSRGARRALETVSIRDLDALSNLPIDSQAFKAHNRLKSDAAALPTRARSVTGLGALTVLPSPRGDIARYAELQVFVAVNFDSSADLLTGLGLRGYFRPWSPFGAPPPDRVPLVGLEVVVIEDTLDNERDVLLAFLQRLGEYFLRITDPQTGGIDPDRNGCQLYFWDTRQYEELTRAIGRHLGVVLSTNSIRGLAWLFPPEELLQNPENSTSPAVAFIKPAILETVAANVPHAYTLFNLVQQYHVTPLGQLPSSYYRDPLSDMIPRERIYEIWHRSTRPVGWQDVLQRYRRTISQQVAALAQVTWRLKRDTPCNGQAPRLRIGGLTMYRGMSQDARVWYAWALLEDNLSSLEAKLHSVARPDKQEASYECIRFTRFLARAGNALTFEVTEDSINSKIEEGDSFLALRCDDIPAFLLSKAYQMPSIGANGYPGDWGADSGKFNYTTFGGASLIRFDRTARQATVQLSDWGSSPTLRAHMERCGSVRFDGMRWSLIKGTGISTAKDLGEVLRSIGNPPFAQPHPATLRIYGAAQARPGRSRATPAARLLWQGRDQYALLSGVPPAEFDAYLDLFGRERLDVSQQAATRSAAERALSLIWGPPGTGKTTTLAALLVCEVMQSAARGRNIRILVTGPTYKALKELAERLLTHLDRLVQTPVVVARAFSSMVIVPNDIPQPTRQNVHLSGFNTSPTDQVYGHVCELLQNPDRPVVVFATPRQALRIVKNIHGTTIGPTFDRCVIDESSQVTVGNAILAMSGLTEDARLTIAGDSLQLPPVSRTQAPLGADFLVGSIHSYFKVGIDLPEEPLLTNYRSSGEFIRFAHLIGYDRRLRSQSPHLRLEIGAQFDTVAAPNWPQVVDYGAWLLAAARSDRRMVTILHDDGVSGQHNPFEAALVTAFCAQFRSNLCRGLRNRLDSAGVAQPADDHLHTAESLWNHAIGIVTPHRSQRVAILQGLRGAFPVDEHASIEEAVDTVEKFQGGERDIVIISFGVGDPDLISDEEEFLLQLERINVAVSRGRAKCICIISRDLAYHLPESKRAVDTSRALKSLIFDVCDQSETHASRVANVDRTLEVRFASGQAG